MSTSSFTFPQRTREACTHPQKNVELQETSVRSTTIGLSLHQHLQQDDAGKEEAGMQNFIMHRFLPAAKEVAAEHGSFIASLASKNHSEVPSPLLPQHSQRTPMKRRVKSRAQQAPEGFAPSRPLHSGHQEDGMPHSMRTCGFFCLGLKTALSSSHRSVSASGRSTLRKQSSAPHPSNHLKVAEKGTSLSAMLAVEMEARKKKAMGGVTRHQSGINVDVPILFPLRSPNNANCQETPLRHAIKHHGSFSRRGRPSSDSCTNVECNPPLSQSGKINLGHNQFEIYMKSIQTSHDDHVSARKFSSAALKEQGDETAQEGVAPCNQKRSCHRESTCVCDQVKNLPPHDLAGDNISRSTMGGLETNRGKPAYDFASRSAWQPRSEFEVLGFECEWVNDELDFTDASSNFETPRASTSENKSVLSDVCTANEKVSSLSQRVGKGLKLETERKQAISPSKHDPCAYEQKHEPQQAELQTRRFSRLRHHSLDSMSGLYLSKASAISPVFPAKCQKNMPNASGWPLSISRHQSSKVGGSRCDTQQEQNIDKYVVVGNVPTPPLPPSPTEPWLGKAVTKNASKPSPLASLQQKEKVASVSLLPPSPTEPWLEKAVTKNACRPSPLATLQQKEKVASASPLPPSPTEPWLGKAVTKNASEPSSLATLQQKEKVASARKTVDFISMNPDAERRWEDVVKGSRRVHRGHLRYSEELEILMLTSL